MPYCITVAKGDPKGLLPGINEAIAKMTSENKMEEFIAAADELSGKRRGHRGRSCGLSSPL